MRPIQVNKPKPFGQELRDYLAFVRQPSLAPRLPAARHGSGWVADWLTPLPWGRMLQWAGFLWALNIFVLGPIALVAALAGGAEHRLDLSNIPWFHALVWAPVVEELVFRFGLRQPRAAVLVFPVAVVAMLLGPGGLQAALLIAVLWFCWRPSYRARGKPLNTLSWPARRLWQRHFGVIVHLSCLAFAAVHLHNFMLNEMPIWLMPLLVLPQWLTGLVLAWLRVRRGIGAAICLHAMFNAGPLLVVLLIIGLTGGVK